MTALVTSIPRLENLLLIEPGLEPLVGQVFYLDFDGAIGVTYRGPIVVQDVDVDPFAVPSSWTVDESTVIRAVVARLEETYQAFGIVFVTEPPLGDTSYSTIFVGGDGSAFAGHGSFLGLAEKVDIGNVDPSDRAFVFSGNVAADSVEEFVGGIAETITHEAAHLLGYEHSFAPGAGGQLAAVALDPQPAAPDGAIYDFTWDDAVYPGHVLILTAYVKNVGSADVPDGTRVSLYWGTTEGSTANFIGSGLVSGEETPPGLQPFELGWAEDLWTVPELTTPGTYWLTSVLDTVDNETVISNNALSKQLIVLPPEPFDIVIQYDGVDAQYQTIIDSAARRWERVFKSGGEGTDVPVTVRVVDIPGTNLADYSAGVIRFDAADIPYLYEEIRPEYGVRTLYWVALHELGHALGLVFSATGSNALNEYRALAHDPSLTSIPLSPVQGHWSETVFGNEVMTIDSGPTISRMSIAALQDRGLYVDFAAADPYSLPAPEISVTGNGVNIADGDTTPAGADHSDFGTVNLGGATFSRVFTVSNTADRPLTTSGLGVPPGFTVTEGLSASIAAGSSDTFTVRLGTASVGTKSGEISFATNDWDESPFNFTITGTVNEPPAGTVLIWSSLLSGSFTFNPNADVLNFDNSAISAADIIPDSPTGVTTAFTHGGKTVTLNTSLLTLTSTNVTFQNGSVFLLGDNTTGTVNDNAANTLTGGAGNDFLSGRGGDDSLSGRAGNDVLEGGSGNDTLIGGSGNDIYVINSQKDVVTETSNKGTDLVQSRVTGLSGYTLASNLENLRLMGTANLNGTGNTLGNELTGNSGKNALNGAAGNDVLKGLAGADVLTGGSGADIFDFDALADSGITTATRDRISDFKKGEDMIDLSTIDANGSGAGNTAFKFVSAFSANATGQVRFDAANHLVLGSTDANSAAEFSISLTGINSMTGASFIL